MFALSGAFFRQRPLDGRLGPHQYGERLGFWTFSSSRFLLHLKEKGCVHAPLFNTWVVANLASLIEIAFPFLFPPDRMDECEAGITARIVPTKFVFLSPTILPGERA